MIILFGLKRKMTNHILNNDRIELKNINYSMGWTL